MSQNIPPSAWYSECHACSGLDLDCNSCGGLGFVDLGDVERIPDRPQTLSDALEALSTSLTVFSAEVGKISPFRQLRRGIFHVLDLISLCLRWFAFHWILFVDLFYRSPIKVFLGIAGVVIALVVLTGCAAGNGHRPAPAAHQAPFDAGVACIRSERSYGDCAAACRARYDLEPDVSACRSGASSAAKGDFLHRVNGL